MLQFKQNLINKVILKLTCKSLRVQILIFTSCSDYSVYRIFYVSLNDSYQSHLLSMSSRSHSVQRSPRKKKRLLFTPVPTTGTRRPTARNKRHGRKAMANGLRYKFKACVCVGLLLWINCYKQGHCLSRVCLILFQCVINQATCTPENVQ